MDNITNEILPNLLSLRASLYEVNNVADELQDFKDDLNDLQHYVDSDLIKQKENLKRQKLSDGDVVNSYLESLRRESIEQEEQINKDGKLKLRKFRKVSFWVIIATMIATVVGCIAIMVLEIKSPSSEYDVYLDFIERVPSFVEVFIIGIIITTLLFIIRSVIYGILKFTNMIDKSSEAKYVDKYQRSKKFEAEREQIVAQNQAKNRSLNEQINFVNKQISNNQQQRQKRIGGLQSDIQLYSKCIQSDISYLDQQYGMFLHISDWENLDYMIYLFITRRADNMKEALHLLDEQKRTDRIVKAIENSAKYLAQNITGAINQLGSSLTRQLNNINSSLGQIHKQIISSAKQAHEDSRGLMQTALTTQYLMSSFAIQSNVMMSNISSTLNKNTVY